MDLFFKHWTKILVSMWLFVLVGTLIVPNLSTIMTTITMTWLVADNYNSNRKHKDLS